MQICKGKTKTGAACRAPATSGGLCFFHANPDSAKTLGQIGGRRNRKFGGVDLEVPENMTATDLRNLMAQAIRLLLSGELQAREATALAQLCNSQHRFIGTADLENRVARLEQQNGQQEQEDESPLEHDSIGAEMNPTGTATGPDAEEGPEEQSACPADACASDS